MEKEKYEKFLRQILGEEKYKKLCEITFTKIDEKFKNQNIISAGKIALTNHLTILIIGLLKSKNMNKCKIIKTLELDDSLSNQYLIESNIDKFMNIYSEYISIIMNYNEEE